MMDDGDTKSDNVDDEGVENVAAFNNSDGDIVF